MKRNYHLMLQEISRIETGLDILITLSQETNNFCLHHPIECLDRMQKMRILTLTAIKIDEKNK